MKGDFSRLTHLPGARYSSVRMQQGRVQLDSDWNEEVDILDHLREKALVDVIGRCGVPQGESGSFKVTLDGTKLNIAGGRVWVEGVLCEHAEALQLDAPAEEGRYAVYLEVWQRLLTTLEAPQIAEVALGGPDTTARTQTVCRVALAKVGESGSEVRCNAVDPDNLALKTTGKLKPSTQPDTAESPCVVPTQAGYARLENQLYRVEVHRSGTVGGDVPPTFKWSRENGSILTTLLEVDGDTIRIADKGRDDVLSFPGSGWIELSHDDLDLAGEPGTLVEVTDAPTASDLGGYKLNIDRHGQTLIAPDPDKHPKVRRWDHAGEFKDGVDIVADSPFDLEGGIKVEFSEGFYRAGDYWLIPARTFVGDFAGDIVWPRASEDKFEALESHGIIRHVCKLAIVDFDGGFGDPETCLKEFPPLTELPESGGGACCGLTVGPGGQFDSVADALLTMPDGGEILILGGTLNERITLNGVDDVIIRGCGRHSRLAPSGTGPAIAISNSTNVAIKSVYIEAATNGECIEIVGSSTHDVVLQDLDLVSGKRSAVLGHDGTRITVRGCRVAMESVKKDDERHPAIFLTGTELRIEDNEIRSDIPSDAATEKAAGGGIQIGGSSSGVRIARNRIIGGLNDGIALGSMTVRKRDFRLRKMYEDVKAERRFDENFLKIHPDAEKATKHYKELEREPAPYRLFNLGALGSHARGRTEAEIVAAYVSDGDLDDIEIRDNEITGTGGNGIATAFFFEESGDEKDGAQDGIIVRDLRILGNRISGCLLVARAGGGAEISHGEGGIALAHAGGLNILGNLIEGNGPPALSGKLAVPVCGVYVGCAEELAVEGNRIVGNGLEPGEGLRLLAGRRGGIVIEFATSPDSLSPNADKAEATSRLGSARQAVRIHENVVDVPAGRAVDLLAYGAVSINDNSLTTRYASLPSARVLERFEEMDYEQLRDSMGGAVVSVLNLGEGNELEWSSIGLRGLALFREAFEGPPRFSTGMTQVQGNRIVLQGIDLREKDFVASLVTVAGLDESGLGSNQIQAEMSRRDSDDEVQVGWSVVVLGSTVRVEGQRIQEPLTEAAFSAFSYGLLNTTSDNRTSHCIIRVAPHGFDGFRNLELSGTMFGDKCRRAREIEKRLEGRYFKEG